MGCGRAPTGVACKQGTSVRPAANVHVEFRREVKNIAQAPFESHRRIVWEGVCLSTLHLQIHFSADNRVISLSASDSGSHSSAGCENLLEPCCAWKRQEISLLCRGRRQWSRVSTLQLLPLDGILSTSLFLMEF